MKQNIYCSFCSLHLLVHITLVEIKKQKQLQLLKTALLTN